MRIFLFISNTLIATKAVLITTLKKHSNVTSGQTE